MSSLFTLTDVEARLKLVMTFFHDDTTEFMVHLSKYFTKDQVKYAWRKKPEPTTEQPNQEEKKKKKKKKKKLLQI